METSLHRELKALYADDVARTEVTLGPYRIDAVAGERLIEIQHGSLAAIRDKVARLVEEHQVLVVKPIVATKRLIKRKRRGGKIVSRRLSPKRGSLLDLFHELIYFRRVFPHRHLTLEVPLVEIEEWRYPGHGRRRRRRQDDHQVEDQKLLEVLETRRFRTPADLRALVPHGLPAPFHTGHLAEALEVDRWIAQRVAYCFRHMNVAREVGKQGNSRLYQFTPGACEPAEAA